MEMGFTAAGCATQVSKSRINSMINHNDCQLHVSWLVRIGITMEDGTIRDCFSIRVILGSLFYSMIVVSVSIRKWVLA